MLDPPFEIIRCSWPRPVAQVGDRWVSEPEWEAPAMPGLPEPQWTPFGGEPCWTIDWCAWFRRGLKSWDGGRRGEMRGFHVVFHLRIAVGGTLTFWDDDGCIIRRNGEVIHADQTTHEALPNAISVAAGDVLEVAQWQNYGAWVWGARITLTADILRPYRAAVQARQAQPNGPPLKIYFGGATPLRTIVALYSMILNGYRPDGVYVFGEYQWSEQSRQVFTEFLPFARIIPTGAVLDRVHAVGPPHLADLARNHWVMMKTCAGVLYPPDEYCLMDDDVFILDRPDDALAAFREHTLVFAPDADYSSSYRTLGAVAGHPPGPLPTGRVNAGLYWLRNTHEPGQIAADLAQVPQAPLPNWQWEQAFIATRYVHETVCALPTQRYFYPYFDGLPGGPAGYDYAHNPCGFVSIHFGGLAEKPSDSLALQLAAAILGRGVAAGGAHPPRNGARPQATPA